MSFVSKVIVKFVDFRFHIYTNSFPKVLQSAYKHFHYKYIVHSDDNLNINKGRVSALSLLDPSAAFDTIGYDIPIRRVSTWYGLSDTDLSWFSLYVADTRQSIKQETVFYACILLPSCGTRHGSF